MAARIDRDHARAATAVIAALCIVFAVGCGGGGAKEAALPQAATAKAVGHPAQLPRGATATLRGKNGLTGRFFMPGFPFGDEVWVAAKHIGVAKGERGYAIWVVRGPRMILLGTWRSKGDGTLLLHDDLSLSKMRVLVSEGPTRIMISRANSQRLYAATGRSHDYQRPSYVGTEVLEGLLTGPGVKEVRDG